MSNSIQGTIARAHMVIDFVTPDGTKCKVMSVALPEFGGQSIEIENAHLNADKIVNQAWERLTINGLSQEPYTNYLHTLNPKGQAGVSKTSEMAAKLVDDAVPVELGMGVMLGMKGASSSTSLAEEAQGPKLKDLIGLDTDTFSGVGCA